MNKKMFWQFKIFPTILLFVVLALTLLINSCTDNQQDRDNTVGDTSVVTQKAATDTIPQRRPNLRDTTKLALLRADAVKYRHGRNFLVIFNNENDARDSLTYNNYNIWFTDTLPRRFSKADRERYALYFYGYLAYHDQNVRTSTGAHTIYFEWYKQKDTTFVNVHITPPYSPGLLEDPPRPKVPPPPPAAIDE